MRKHVSEYLVRMKPIIKLTRGFHVFLQPAGQDRIKHDSFCEIFDRELPDKNQNVDDNKILNNRRKACWSIVSEFAHAVKLIVML